MNSGVRPMRDAEIGNEIARLSVWEIIAAVVIAAPILAGLSLRVSRLRPIVLTWLDRQDILVHDTLVSLPGTDGLGLDLNRLLVFLGLAGLAIWVTAQAVGSRRIRLLQSEQRSAGHR